MTGRDHHPCHLYAKPPQAPPAPAGPGSSVYKGHTSRRPLQTPTTSAPLKKSLPRTPPGTFPTTSYNPPTHIRIHQTDRWTDRPQPGLAHSPTGILGADSLVG